ncbi:hypothetical protein PACTADRAFT_50914 [Pachysolen tannophilus NRRL Y-2460]|uniref:ATP-dependent 6-phosphofructokinase n=1 Tax=Pachysolen tannophilus NRRL Y-2460 TaxID=669874 RepID=A0A1E4TTN8_PACTA|nr:hypothetical protein PACTADRAFT_50914 [Pachysolen tannophilus NRRL Y-2460]
MVLKNPLTSGYAYFSFTTNDSEKFEKAVSFYKALKFQPAREFSKGIKDESNLRGVSRDSLKEVWLESFPLGPLHQDALDSRLPVSEVIEDVSSLKNYETQGVVLKIRLSSQDIDENTILPVEINLFSSNVEKLRQNLIQLNIEILPSKNDQRISYYIKDPIGNLLGFTSFQSPLEIEQITNENFFLHPKLEKLTNNFEDEEIKNGSELKSQEKIPKKKIAVMTSGGDSQGMCAAVRAVVRAGIFYECDVFACFEGYSGLVKGGNLLRKLGWEDVRGWTSLGGTLIGTARCMEFKERSGRLSAAYNMVTNGIDALIVCGGDGSLTGADLFRSEWPSLLEELYEQQKLAKFQIEKYKTLKIVGLVGSIDNDMACTDATIGAYSSLERICEMVDYIDATAESHSRAFVVEVMGRHCGWLGLMAGIATGADAIFIPERPPEVGKWKDDLKTVCKRHREKGRRKTVVIVSEGAIDRELNAITSDAVKDVLVEMGLDTRTTILGHVQRGGTAVAFDRMLATLQGVDAVKAVLEMTPDTPSPMIGILESKIVRQPLVRAVELTKSVATAIANKDFDKAISLRDSTFLESYQNFLSVSSNDDGSQTLPEDKRLNIAVIHVGAPSSGLNAATRAACLYCLSRGHTFYAIENGFSGLVRHGSIKKLNWSDVENWHSLGGSEIGTNRTLPSQDLGTVAFYLQQHDIQGLMIIGGFEAFTALRELEQAREKYPIFNMPLCVLPATVSNNVPGTQYSLGSDTCLNQLVKYCDEVKQSASASRRRVFVVEVQGGNSGYVASYTGLVTGALTVYTPEKKTSLRSIQEDIELLRDNFAHDEGANRSGKLFIRNEKASTIYTTQLIADIIKEHGSGKFESRTGIPGHVQQGKVPSSMDRINATRFAIKCCEFIENLNFDVNASNRNPDPEVRLRFKYSNGQKKNLLKKESDSASVIGIDGSQFKFQSIEDLWLNEADFVLRKGKTIHWEHMNEINDMLSGRLMLRKQNH